MQYTNYYCSPIGKMLLAADGTNLTGLWFEGGKFYAAVLDSEHEEKELPVFEIVKKWLDIYFTGKNPDFTPPVHLQGSPFRMMVRDILKEIPYGQTMTYNEIAKHIAKAKGLQRMSAQAVGGAVAHNPVSIIIPCHRVIGSDGSLTGYAGGIDKKVKLLQYEGVHVDY